MSECCGKREDKPWPPAYLGEGAPETVLDEAASLTSTDRQNTYGPPSDDFERIAGAWRSLFGWDVKPEQVALAMVVLKVSRLQTTPEHRDSVVDIAGYARTYEMVRLEDQDAGGYA